ncbi:MAG: DinB family protein [Muriicola sp.]|nr:DinB family protein [Muriicola sp.]
MATSAFIAKHIKEFYFGGNWTAVNLKDSLSGLNWEQAAHRQSDLHSVAELVYHINYFVRVVLRVLEGKPLEGKDAESFDCPPIQNESDWTALKDKTWKDAEIFIRLVQKLSDKQLSELLADEKYGSYERNLIGIIEHSHYHLGQIVLLRKLLKSSNN